MSPSINFCSGNTILSALIARADFCSGNKYCVFPYSILPEQLCGSILSQFPRHDRLNQLKNDTRVSYLTEIITMSTCFHKNISPTGRACTSPSMSTSSLAIRFFSRLFPLAISAEKLLIARAALAIV